MSNVINFEGEFVEYYHIESLGFSFKKYYLPVNDKSTKAYNLLEVIMRANNFPIVTIDNIEYKVLEISKNIKFYTFDNDKDNKPIFHVNENIIIILVKV